MIRYKKDIDKELKRLGYTASIIQKNKLLPSQTLQNIRAGKSITLDTLNKLCIMLRCQPSDLIECVVTDEEKIKYFR
ncbi:MAG: helix-turn-helix domain-containing protein [Bacteroidaceae bacterium]|jgi:DNA-binding Xre family transcriptional regulator|nr:helix-turn-helix domain-containing protein [Bacteroidaceae bacterium]